MRKHRIFISYVWISACLALIWCAGPEAAAQPRDINGTVKTPAGAPIMDAYVYIDPGTYGSSYYTNSLGGYTVIYMPGYANKYLRIVKDGWEFTPPWYLITAATSGNLTRNFTGVRVQSLTSGGSGGDTLDAGGSSYFSMQVPDEATQLDATYEGTGDGSLAAQLGSIPSGDLGKGSAERRELRGTVQTLVLNASSTPALAAGKWYLAVQAVEATQFTLTVRLRGPGADPVVAGWVVRSDSVTTQPLAGVGLLGSNGVTTETTDQLGLYSMSVPYDWSGTLQAVMPGGQFTPAQREYSHVTADMEGQVFVQQMVTSATLQAYLLGRVALESDEQMQADFNADTQVDIADMVRAVNDATTHTALVRGRE